MISCPYCSKKFSPNREWQKTCGNVKCIMKHKAKLNEKWREEHPKYHKQYMMYYQVKIIKRRV